VAGSFTSLAGPGLTYAGPDQGIDFTGKGNVLAPDTSKILSETNASGWPGQHEKTVLQFLSGPEKGRYWEITEDFQPTAPVGATVQKGGVIGYGTGSGLAPGIEVGFSQSAAGLPYGTPNMGKPGGPAPVYGQAFASYVQGQKSSGGGGILGDLGSAASSAAGAVGGAASDAFNAVTGAPGDVAGAVTGAIGSVFSGFFKWLEGGLEKGALYGVFVVGGVALAGYGLVKTLGPTGGTGTLTKAAEAAAV
jgi:hypothetical protein